MARIWNVFIELREAVTLAICIIVSILLLFTSDKDPGAPVRQMTYTAVGGIGSLIQEIHSYFYLREINAELRRSNVVLSYNYQQLQDALLENIRLRKMLEFKEKSTLNVIPAEVVGKNPQSIFNGLILNAGRRSKIVNEQTVLTAEGLVGKIVRVQPDFSICQILLDRNSRVSAKIQRNRELGIIAWDGGTRLKMMYIAKTIKVLVGDVIVTSGYSSIFPENLKIGVVIDVSLDVQGMFQEIIVQPSVNFNRLEEVFVVIGEESHEKPRK